MSQKQNSNFILFESGLNKPLTPEFITELKERVKNGAREISLSDDNEVPYKYSIDDLSQIEELEILRLCDYKLKINKFPPNLKELYTGHCFHQSIGTADTVILPDSIEKLVFGFRFNSKIDIFPKNLKHLEFGKKYNYPLNNLPEGLEKLYLTGDFNQYLDSLPSSLKIISMFGLYSCEFNHPIDNLPDGLEELYLNGSFNQSIDLLPSNLKMLYLNKNFDLPINNLPNRLDTLVFQRHGKFNLPLTNIPDSIETLKLPESYSQEIKKLPKNLKRIELSKKYGFLNYFEKHTDIDVFLY